MHAVEAMVKELHDELKVSKAKAGESGQLKERVAEMAVALQAQKTDLGAVISSQANFGQSSISGGDNRRVSVATPGEPAYESRTGAVLMDLFPRCRTKRL